MTSSVVLFRVGTGLCAIPVGQVVETMRPLPVQPLAGVPGYVRGVSVIRGAAVPVVDLAALVLGTGAEPGRLVTVRAEQGTVALAVSEVVGVATITEESLAELPPLLGDARREAVRSIGTAGTGTLLLLDGARAVPDEVWAAMTAGATA